MKFDPRRRLAALSPPVQAVAWMVFSTLMFSGAAAAVRRLSADVHFIEVSFFRSFFGLLIMLPWLARVGIGALRTEHQWNYIARGLSSAVAMFLWFGGLALVPIAEATAISFTTPFIITIAAFLFLHEPMRLPRWIGLAVGFAGTLIIVRPGFAEVNLGMLMVLTAGVFIATSALNIKVAARDDSPDTVAIYQVLYMLPLTFVPALFFWTWPTWEGWCWALAVGVFSTYGQRTYTRALALADASAVTPLDFLRLPFAGLLGFFLFDELPDIWTIVGGVVIFAASAYVGRHEATARRLKKPAT
jgi:drug/metabolite transporter (DMT)-like permease